MASRRIAVLNEVNFDEVVRNTKGPVLVEFTATWCGPCRAQAAILERIAEGSGAPFIAEVDVDECPALAARFGVRGMPTLLVFRDGRETGRRLGLATEAAIQKLVAAPSQRELTQSAE